MADDDDLSAVGHALVWAPLLTDDKRMLRGEVFPTAEAAEKRLEELCCAYAFISTIVDPTLSVTRGETRYLLLRLHNNLAVKSVLPLASLGHLPDDCILQSRGRHSWFDMERLVWNTIVPVITPSEDVDTVMEALFAHVFTNNKTDQ
jgi:hypothetical protein